MYCTNCAKEIDPNATICIGCGVLVGKTAKYCKGCAAAIEPEASICIHCGKAVEHLPLANAKSKMVAGLLGIFLGTYGIHNFYLGNTNKAILQVLLGTVGAVAFGLGPLCTFVWGLVEGIMLLTGQIDRDGKGDLLAP